MIILDIIKVNICGTREYSYNAGWILVTSQHHIETDKMKVKPPLSHPVSQRYLTMHRQLLSDLDFTASTVWRSALANHLHFRNFRVPVYKHISNINLEIFSYRSFLKKAALLLKTFVCHTCCSEGFVITGP